MNPRIPTILATLAVATTPSLAEAKPRLQVEDLVKHAKGDPWRCDIDRDSRWGEKQNRCLVRVIFKRYPAAGRAATKIVYCETGGTWDEYAKNRSSSASGLAQWLYSSWQTTPYRRHSRFHPVFAIKAMYWTWRQDGSFRQWSCARIVGVR